MYRATITGKFSSAHSLRGYRGSCENLHGHNWKVEVTVAGETLDEVGMLVDFRILKEKLGAITDRLDHVHLNEIPPFDSLNPSSENIAKFIFDAMSSRLDVDTVSIDSVKVWESDNAFATYSQR